MRSNLMARIISGAAALTLLASSAVFAQSATPPPAQFGPTLRQQRHRRATSTTPRRTRSSSPPARDMHVLIGGKTSRQEERLERVGPQPDSSSVIDAVLDMAQLENDVIVISGGDNQATVGHRAGSFENTDFIDVGQQLPCVTPDGQSDPSGTCEGGDFSVPANYSAIDFAVEDGAYLAGVLAAAASRDDRLGIISGASDCVECNRYIRGFVLGALQRRPVHRYRAGLPRRRRGLRVRRSRQRPDLRRGVHRRVRAQRALAGRPRRVDRHDRGGLQGGHPRGGYGHRRFRRTPRPGRVHPYERHAGRGSRGAGVDAPLRQRRDTTDGRV